MNTPQPAPPVLGMAGGHRHAEGPPSVQLAAMQALPDLGAASPPWRLDSGLLCLGPCQAMQTAAPVYGIASAGDWVCVPPAGVTAWALLPSVLSACDVPASGAGWQALLAQLSAQHCRQAADLAALRTGPAADRVRHLLLLLARPGAALPGLPPLRAMAQLVDAAPETVSRVVSALRQLQLLEGSRRGATSVNAGGDRLAARALPTGLTRSAAATRHARLQTLQGAALSSPLAFLQP